MLITQRYSSSSQGFYLERSDGLYAWILSLSARNTALCMQKKKKKCALPGNRTRVARMGILHDTTTLAVQHAQTHHFTESKALPISVWKFQNIKTVINWRAIVCLMWCCFSQKREFFCYESVFVSFYAEDNCISGQK